MGLNLKLLTLFMSWFITSVLTVSFGPEAAQAKSIKPANVADNSSTLLAQGQQEELNAFYNSGKYTYCDAKVLGNYWNQSVNDAKIRIGYKLLGGRDNINFLNQEQSRARQVAVDRLWSNQQLCFFSQKGLTYEDAVALADYWGSDTPFNAKMYVEKLLIRGNYQEFGRAMDAARNQYNGV